MPPVEALEMYNTFKRLVADEYGEFGDLRVHDGVFGAMMDVELVNDGPVTLLVESPSGLTG